MRRNKIGLIWLGGLAFAVFLDLIGPDHFIDVVSIMFARLADDIDNVIRVLSSLSLDFVRSAAIAIFVVFLVLASMATRRGIKARRAIIMVSGLFLLLVYTAHPGASTRWDAALILVTIAALVMTRRLQKNTGSISVS